MKDGPIYLDHHATTPCDPRVVEAMLPSLHGVFGNPASRQHAFGRHAAELVETARAQIAELISCTPSEIVFTSGATEADNLALKGLAFKGLAFKGLAFKGLALGRSGASHGLRADSPLGHIITTATEHKAVLDVCAHLERQGLKVTYLGVDADGRVDPARVEDAIREDTILVSLMLANNEIGTLHPISEIACVCKRKGVLLHTDAAQALAYVDCDVDRLGVDLMSLSAHKAYGPKGIGALYLRRRRPRVRLSAQIDGGGHERGRRSGTLNVPGIVGFGQACALVKCERRADSARQRLMRDTLLERLKQAFPDLRVHGSMAHRLPNNLNVSIPGLSSEALLDSLDTVAISSGAACSAANADGSYVIKALPGADASIADSSLRMGLGRFTTEDEMERATDALIAAIHHQRQHPIPAVEDACGPVTCAPAMGGPTTSGANMSGPA